MDARTVEQIDADLHVEAVELAYARRGPGAALVEARARIDRLLDERLSVVVRDPQRTPPDAGHAGVVQ